MKDQRMKWDAEAAFKKIEEGMYRHMALPFPPEWVTPHRSGWTPAPDPRAYMKAKPDVYKGRDYEALTKAALRKPVGYWEDAPRGMKFGGSGASAVGAQVARSATGGDAVQLGVPATSNRAAPTTTPQSADDEFEPVGTKVQIGDRITARIDMGWADGIGAFTVAYINENGVFGSDANPRLTSQDYMDAGKRRILKRPTKPRDDVATGARAWKNTVSGVVWARIGDKTFCGPVDSQPWSREKHCDGLDPGAVYVELHGPERDAIVAECRKAMGI